MKTRTLEIWQTAGFSERSHKYFMKIQNSNFQLLKIMNRGFIWWGAYRYQQHPHQAFTGSKFYH